MGTLRYESSVPFMHYVSPVSATLEPLLTARDLADRLAVSASTILDWWQAGRLPGFKLHSGAVRFRESEILEWLEAQRA